MMEDRCIGVNELRCRDRDGKGGCTRMDGSLVTVV